MVRIKDLIEIEKHPYALMEAYMYLDDFKKSSDKIAERLLFDDIIDKEEYEDFRLLTRSIWKHQSNSDLRDWKDFIVDAKERIVEGSGW